MLFPKTKRSGTVLSVTKATRRTESKNGATSITASAVDSVGSKCLNGGKLPSKVLEVIVFSSDTKPTSFSIDVVGESANVICPPPAKDLAASIKVLALRSVDASRF